MQAMRAQIDDERICKCERSRRGGEELPGQPGCGDCQPQKAEGIAGRLIIDGDNRHRIARRQHRACR
jgi:hypothetical protein